MRGSGRRTKTRRGLAVMALAGLAIAAFAAAASARVFYPTDRYDCFAYQAVTGGLIYIDSYQFEPGNRYAVGIRNVRSRTGLSSTFAQGSYRLLGNRIVSTSGYLTRLHDYLLIETNGLALVKNNGAFQSIGCYDYAKHTIAPTPGGGLLGGATSAIFSCYETQYSDGAYTLYPGYATSLEFWSDGTYMREGSIRDSGWHQNGNTITFNGGALWSTYAHDVATWYPSGGVPMPHPPAAQAGLRFSLVVRDTVAEGGEPPSVEFATSGPDATVPSSYLYCRR